MVERSLIDNYKTFHASMQYGAGGRHLPYILRHVSALRPRSIVDYGAGNSDIVYRLGRRLGADRMARYEPAIPELSTLPKGPFDLVVSFDVLEHIPDEELDSVFSEMKTLSPHALLIIDTVPAKKFLTNGQNAHVSLHDGEWWLRRARQFFPTLRSFPIKSQGRVALKTWDGEDTGLVLDLLEKWEEVRYRVRKRVNYWKRRRARQKTATT